MDLPGSDWGDFSCRRAVDSSSLYKFFLYSAASTSHRKRLLLTPEFGGGEEEDDPDGSSDTYQPEEVLVVSMGVVNECPGMLTEQKVRPVSGEGLYLTTLWYPWAWSMSALEC